MGRPNGRAGSLAGAEGDLGTGAGMRRSPCPYKAKGDFVMQKNENRGVSRRTFLKGSAAGAMLVGLGLVGCGGSKGGDTGTQQSSTGTAATADSDGFIVKASKTDGKSSDNDLVVAIEGHMSALHPMNWSDGNDGNVVNAVYEPLVKLDDANQNAIIPWLATKWEVSDDALTYTFHLREGVKFTDGSTLNAKLVCDNCDYTTNVDNKFRRRRMFVISNEDGSEKPRIASWKAVDDMTVAFTLAAPWSPFLTRMAQFYIVGAEAVADPTLDLNQKSYGSGPFMLKEWVSSDHTTVVPNPDFWGDKKPTVDSVTFREMPEAGARIAALQTGEVDFAYPTPSDQIETIRSAGDVNMKAQKSVVMRYVTLNVNIDGLKEEKVRQAINYAVDKNAWTQVMYSGFADVARSCIPEPVSGFKEQTPYDVDLDKAKSLMKEAGYENGFDVTLWCDSSTQEQKGGTFIMQQLQQIGINVDVQPMEAATVADKAALPEGENEIQMWYVNWSQNDADGYMRSLLDSANVPPVAYNTAFWKNAEFDQELDAGNAAASTDEQNQHYGKAQDIAWQACPWIFLGSDNLLFSYKSYVSGVKMTSDSTIDISEAALEH